MRINGIPLKIFELIGPRGRNILHTSAWSLIGKFASAANLFISVPFVLRTLGTEQFGAWATLVSFVFFAGFLDFGFGNGTMNLIAAAKGRNAPDEIANIWFEGLRVLSRVSLILAGLTLFAIPLVPWSHVLGMSNLASNSSRNAASVVLISIVFAIPLNLASRVQLGLGRGNKSFQWQTLGQLLALCVVIVSARAHASLAILTAAAVTTPLLGALGNTIQLQRIQRLAVNKTKYVHRNDIAKKIRFEGTQFFILQLASSLAFASDLPLISALRGPSDAGIYSIIQKPFSIIPIGLSLLWVPLWPAYRQALAAGDYKWVFRTLRHSLILAIALAGGGAILIALNFEKIIAIWLDKPLNINRSLLLGFIIWSVLDAFGTALAAFLNAASIMRYQVIVGVIFGLSCVSAKFFLLQTLSFQALPWITSIIYSLTCLFPILILLPKIIKDTKYKSF